MSNDAPLPSILFVGRDLLFSSRVTGAAQAEGVRVDVVGDSAAAIERIQGGAYCGLLLDLSNSSLDLAAVLDSLPRNPRPRVIAFDSHVATARLEAARTAGCDEVMPRSRFSATLPDLLRSCRE